MHEARFNAELLATLLSIPQGKTLLRRHLATHFNQLVGREVVQAKREMETSSAYPPLTPVAKVKVCNPKSIKSDSSRLSFQISVIDH